MYIMKNEKTGKYWSNTSYKEVDDINRATTYINRGNAQKQLNHIFTRYQLIDNSRYEKKGLKKVFVPDLSCEFDGYDDEYYDWKVVEIEIKEK